MKKAKLNKKELESIKGGFVINAVENRFYGYDSNQRIGCSCNGTGNNDNQATSCSCSDAACKEVLQQM